MVISVYFSAEYRSTKCICTCTLSLRLSFSLDTGITERHAQFHSYVISNAGISRCGNRFARSLLEAGKSPRRFSPITMLITQLPSCGSCATEGVVSPPSLPRVRLYHSRSAVSPAGICVIPTISHARARMRLRCIESPPRRVAPPFQRACPSRQTKRA